MKSVWGESRARFPRICDACFNALGPKRQLRSPLGLDVLRAPADGMVKIPDPQAEQVKAKKARKAEKAAMRAAFRVSPIAAAKFFLSGVQGPPPSDECPACLALNHRAA